MGRVAVRLKTRLLPIYLVALILVVGIGGLALVRLNQISVTVDNLTNELAVDRALSKDIVSQIFLTRFYANRYVRTQDQRDLDAFNAAFAQLKALLVEADAQITCPERVTMLNRIDKAVATYGETFEEVTVLVKRRQRIYAEVLDIQNLAMENALLALRVDVGFSGNMDVFLAFGNLQSAIYQVHLDTARYLEEGNPKYAIQLASNYRKMLTALDSLEAILKSSRYGVYITEIRTAAQSYYEGFEVIRVDYVQSQALLTRMFDELEPEISMTAAEMAASIDQAFIAQNATSQRLIAQTRAVLLTTTAVAVLAGVGLAGLISRYLTERLQAERALRQYRDHLEHLVGVRTAELTQTNARLRQEIAERKRTEAALRESEASLARAQSIAHLGSWSLDVAQNKVEWSDEMYRLLGLTPGEPAEPSFDLGFIRTHPDDRAALQAIYEESLAVGRAEFEADFRTVPIDGQIRTLRMLAQVERNADGEVTRVFGVDVDITARKQAEEALRRSEENFRQLFEANPFPLLISRHEDDEILMANQAMADFLDMPLNELVGSRSMMLNVVPADHQTIMRELAKHGKVINGILRVKTRVDQQRVILLNVVAIEQQGQILRLAGAADITAQIEAEETAQAARAEAEAANRAKSMFLANMSHELRTPLNAILGFSDLMARDPNLTREQRENLDTIERSGEHLLELINSVLDLSKIESGKAELEIKVFDLHEMLLSLGEMFSLRAEARDLTVVFDLAPGMPRYIRADVGKVRQVLINLLGNAVKFTERGGITVRVAIQDFGRRGPLD